MNDDLNEDPENPDGGEEVVANEADQQGFLLKIAVGGITVQDYVKRLNEDDILVAIDGKAYLDGPQRLRSTFLQDRGEEAKWLLTFYRSGVLFDILIEHPIKSAFGYSTKNETEFVLTAFSQHTYGDFQSYENFEIYRDPRGKCDILSFRPDPLAWMLPPLWLLKYRLYPPLAVVSIMYLLTFVVNIYLFIATAIMLAIYVNRAQNNLMRSFTMYEDKYHYMTIAAANEIDVSLAIKRIDPNNKIRYERNVIKRKVNIKKTIEKSIDDNKE
tara:strand:+ start:2964 stop:3776 length:813 start_codon:yes stop_codon:yes gene_type:complete